MSKKKLTLLFLVAPQCLLVSVVALHRVHLVRILSSWTSTVFKEAILKWKGEPRWSSMLAWQRVITIQSLSFTMLVLEDSQMLCLSWSKMRDMVGILSFDKLKMRTQA